MTNEELSYIAGFFDGEGSVTIHQNGGPSPRGQSPNHTLQVSVCNTDPIVIRWIHATFGGNYCLRKAPTKVHKPVHQWLIRAREALPFLRAIEPFIRMKNRQVRLAIEFQERKQMRGPKRLSAEDIAWREDQRTLLRILNGRNAGRGNVPQVHL